MDEETFAKQNPEKEKIDFSKLNFFFDLISVEGLDGSERIRAVFSIADGEEEVALSFRDIEYLLGALSRGVARSHNISPTELSVEAQKLLPVTELNSREKWFQNKMYSTAKASIIAKRRVVQYEDLFSSNRGANIPSVER